MALKLLFFCCKITKIAQCLGAPPPNPCPQSLHFYIFSDYARSATRLSCISFLARGLNQTSFVQRKNKLLVQPSYVVASIPQNPGCVSSSIHCSCRKVFQSIMGRKGSKLHKKRCGPFNFSRHECRIFKIAHT